MKNFISIGKKFKIELFNNIIVSILDTKISSVDDIIRLNSTNKTANILKCVVGDNPIIEEKDAIELQQKSIEEAYEEASKNKKIESLSDFISICLHNLMQSSFVIKNIKLVWRNNSYALEKLKIIFPIFSENSMYMDTQINRLLKSFRNEISIHLEQITSEEWSLSISVKEGFKTDKFGDGIFEEINSIGNHASDIVNMIPCPNFEEISEKNRIRKFKTQMEELKVIIAEHDLKFKRLEKLKLIKFICSLGNEISNAEIAEIMKIANIDSSKLYDLLLTENHELKNKLSKIDFSNFKYKQKENLEHELLTFIIKNVIFDDDISNYNKKIEAMSNSYIGSLKSSIPYSDPFKPIGVSTVVTKRVVDSTFNRIPTSVFMGLNHQDLSDLSFIITKMYITGRSNFTFHPGSRDFTLVFSYDAQISAYQSEVSNDDIEDNNSIGELDEEKPQTQEYITPKQQTEPQPISDFKQYYDKYPNHNKPFFQVNKYEINAEKVKKKYDEILNNVSASPADNLPNNPNIVFRNPDGTIVSGDTITSPDTSIF